ncbi:TusE/DsrC/DsvC family sulfur relay protein [Spongiibacter taiwanensis]|uniref:TusE/DsrC/DsvC family sulfur relay protein n=1 Tax=Spongiibacter taiwanensis TaxID=1748242 RepID=UPI0020358D6D|nr:TusE/DsrC/DsvC family sulfur relay protein [Spongiibacter taiwanensis]USA43311.1 TusE/DsrC/DsvC family sulfur relay protein [Spongiibacter taiwanensis]
MSALQVKGRDIPVDKDGFLKNLADWDAEVAEALAASEGITLDQPRWQLIELVQRFYQEFGLSPAMRPLVKYARQNLGEQQGSSLYFLRLFPGSPAKLLSKIAGLPRPDNCL